MLEEPNIGGVNVVFAQRCTCKDCGIQTIPVTSISKCCEITSIRNAARVEKYKEMTFEAVRTRT